MRTAKLTVLLLGLAVGAVQGVRARSSEPSEAEKRVLQLSAAQRELTRELVAVRAELRAQARATSDLSLRLARLRERPVDATAPAVAPLDSQTQLPQEALAHGARPAVQPDLEALQATERLLDEAAADGIWDEARALLFRVRLGQLSAEHSRQLLLQLTRMVNDGELTVADEVTSLL
jgi:hypothetical protein